MNSIKFLSFILMFSLALSACSNDGSGVTNTAPVADAGVDQHIKTTSLVTLDASDSSDADHDLLTYSWTMTSEPAVSGAVLSDTSSSHPTFKADAEGDYTFKLIVNDGTIDSTESTVTVTATLAHLNAKPVADAGQLQNPSKKVGEVLTVTLDGSHSSDADHNHLAYAWTVESKPLASTVMVLTNPTSAAPTFIADEEGEYVLKLIVNDGLVNSAPDTVTVTVSHGNSAPVAAAGPNQEVKTGEIVHLDGSHSSDADQIADSTHPSLNYLWSIQSKPSRSTASLTGAGTSHPTFIADIDGVYVIKMLVRDADAAPSATVTITAKTTNSAPVANAGPDQPLSKKVGEVLNVTLDGSGSSDVNHDALEFTWFIKSTPSNSGASLAGFNTLKPTFTADVEGVYSFTLIVYDGTVDSVADTVNVTVSHGNSAPVAEAGRNQHVKVGTVVTLDGSDSSDADNDPFSFGWVFQHKTATPDASLAAFSDNHAVKPTFKADIEGAYDIRLYVLDPDLGLGLDTVTVYATAVGTNSSPVANAGPDRYVETNTSVTLDSSASTDADGETLVQFWVSLHTPEGSNVVVWTHEASPTFTPDVEGAYVFKLSVSDGSTTPGPDVLDYITIHATNP